MKRSIAITAMLSLAAWAWGEQQAVVETPMPVETPATKAAAPAPQPPPLPVHTIEGYGGGAITPTAYLVNPGPKGEVFGLPSASFTGVWIGNGKNLESVGITETLFGRVELGFAAERFDIGDVKDDIKAGTGVDLSRDDVYLYNFNARAMVIEENSFCKFTPALTAGVHYKYNDGIDSIDDQLFGSFSDIGLENNQGVEFTLMASKMFPKLGFGRPLIVSAGLRETQAAWMGFLGFSDEWSTNFEGNVIWLPFDWMAVGYELRQQSDPYDQIPGLVEDEDWLQTFSVILMPNSHFNVSLVYGLFGRVLNEDENHVLAVQAKWEF